MHISMTLSSLQSWECISLSSPDDISFKSSFPDVNLRIDFIPGNIVKCSVLNNNDKSFDGGKSRCEANPIYYKYNTLYIYIRRQRTSFCGVPACGHNCMLRCILFAKSSDTCFFHRHSKFLFAQTCLTLPSTPPAEKAKNHSTILNCKINNLKFIWYIMVIIDNYIISNYR